MNRILQSLMLSVEMVSGGASFDFFFWGGEIEARKFFGGARKIYGQI